MAIACACCVHRGPQWRPGATGFQPGKHRWWMIWMCPTPNPPLNISKAEFGKVCFFVFEPTNRPETSVWLSQFRYFVFLTKKRIWDYSDRLGSQFAISCPCVVFIKASCNPVWNFGAWLKNCGNPLGQPKEGMRGGVAQLSTSFRSHLVGGWPTSLKNDGVSVSWDDDIPNWMEKSSGSSKPPTSQKNRIWNKRNQHITRVPRGMNRWITISPSYFAEQNTFSSSTAIHFSALTPFLNAKTTGAKWQVL